MGLTKGPPQVGDSGPASKSTCLLNYPALILSNSYYYKTFIFRSFATQDGPIKYRNKTIRLARDLI